MPSTAYIYEKVRKEGSDIGDHLTMLYDAAKGNVMEIGVRQGASTAALLAGIEAHGGHLWSVDIKDCNCFPDNPDWTFIQADSVQDAGKIKGRIPESLELLFIDGDHSFQGVLGDLLNYGGRAKCIMLHDAENAEHPGVAAAIEAYCGWNNLDYVLHSGSYGMAVITK